MRANIWRVVLTAIFVAVGATAYAQLDARSMMNAQRQQQQGLGPNGLPADSSQQGANGEQTDENGNNGEQADSTKKKRPRKPLPS